MDESPDTFLNGGVVKIIVGYAVKPEEAINAAYPVSVLRWYKNVLDISMEYYIRGELGASTCVLDYACKYNKLDLAKFLVDEVGVVAEIRQGDVIIFVDQSSNYKDTIDINWYPFRRGLESGYLQMSSWIIERFGLTRDDPYNRDRVILTYAVQTGQLEIVKLIVDKLGFHKTDTKEHLINTARRNNYHHIAKWFENYDGLK